MPQVPYQGYPTQEPKEIPTPTLGFNTPGAAFGENIARAVEGFGKATEHVGDELFQRALGLQQLRNETEAREADATFTMEAGKLHAEYSTLEGKAAVDALPKHMETLNSLRLKVREGLSNDDSRRRYDSQALGFMARNIFNAAGHAAGENKKYVLGGLKAQEDAVYDDVAHNPDSEAAVTAGRERLHDVVDTEATMRGWGKDQAVDEANKKTSRMVMQRITSMAMNGKPMQAKDLFDSQKEFLRGHDLENTEKVVDTYVRSSGSRIIAERIVAAPEDGKFEKPLAEMLAEGREAAKKLNPNDPLLSAQVEKDITSRQSMLNHAKTQFDYENRDTINGALLRNQPTTLSELLADPDAARAWQHLDATHQKQFLTSMSAIAKLPDRERRSYEDSPEGLERYKTLRGMALNDPKEFLEQNITNERFTFGTLRRLTDMQAEKSKKAEGDPRVTNALSVLRHSRGPTMESLGIYNRTKDKDAYDHFVGALQDSLEIFQQNNKKAPNSKEIEEMGDRLMYQQKVPPAWYWPFTTEDRPVYDVAVPDEFAKGLTADILAKGGTAPSDEQTRRAYIRTQLLKLYAKQPTEK